MRERTDIARAKWYDTNGCIMRWDLCEERVQVVTRDGRTTRFFPTVNLAIDAAMDAEERDG